MSRLRLSHWFSSHLSVVLYTVAPALIAVTFTTILLFTLCWLNHNLKGNQCELSGSSWSSSLHVASLPYLPTAWKVVVFGIIMIIMERSSLSIFDDKTCSFSLSLPSPWGVPLAWSLSALPLLPLLVGLLVHLVLAGEVRLLFLYPHPCRTPLVRLLVCLIIAGDSPLHFPSHPILSNETPHNFSRWKRAREASENFLYSLGQMVTKTDR